MCRSLLRNDIYVLIHPTGCHSQRFRIKGFSRHSMKKQRGRAHLLFEMSNILSRSRDVAADWKKTLEASSFIN